jgi:hypothetical protein
MPSRTEFTSTGSYTFSQQQGQDMGRFSSVVYVSLEVKVGGGGGAWEMEEDKLRVFKQ